MISIAEFARPDEILRQTALTEKGITIEQVSMGAAELPPHYHAQHLLIVYQAPAVVVEQQRGIQQQQALFTPGDVGIYPAGEYGKVAWKAPVDNLLIHIDAPMLLTFAETKAEFTQFALTDHFAVKDPMIGNIGRMLLDCHLSDASTIPLYIDALADMLSWHLLQHYAQVSRKARPDSAIFSAAIVRRIDEYISVHLADAITLASLAELANISVFHFARRFKKTTGLSPYQYVLSRRTEHARQLLRQLSLSVADIACQLGFGSVGHFDAFFKKQTGFTPRQYRQN